MQKFHFNFISGLQGWPTCIDQVWSNFVPNRGNLQELIQLC